MKKLSHLMKRLSQYVIYDEWDVTIENITDDSRCVKPGGMFVAIPGVTVDGHHFIGAAIKAGAVAIVGELEREEIPVNENLIYIRVPDSRHALGQLHASWFDYPSDHLTLIGVTGTDGKTTTTNLIYAILSAAGINTGMVSTVNARIGASSYETGLHTTTPPAEEIQKYLSEMVADGATHAVLETTSHGLDQKRLSGCEFDTAVITNVTHEHLDYHGTWDHYMAAKASLFEGLTKPSLKTTPKQKTAILNYDDSASFNYLNELNLPLRFSYSIESTVANVRAESIQFTPEGLVFNLLSLWGTGRIHSRLFGLYNVSNILAAATAALSIGLPMDAVIAGVNQVKGVSGRMENIDLGQDFLAVVDFAHTPNALERVLQTAREIVAPDNRIIVVFGCAGLRDKEKRWMMGEKAALLADKIVITAEDPRTESLQNIMADIENGIKKYGKKAGLDYWCVEDRGEAILHAVTLARSGDIVLTCGKGHEQSMCFGDTEYPWDDRQALTLALQGKTLSTLPTSKSQME